MHRFEEIMTRSNYEAFRILVDAAKNKTLVCYVGAGLSLYSKRWGEPFEIIVEKLIADAEEPRSRQQKLRKKLQKLHLIQYALEINKTNSIEEKKSAKEALLKRYPKISEKTIRDFENKTYPLIGDEIEDIIIACQLHIIGGTPPTGPTDRFCDWMRWAFETIRKNKENNPENTEVNLPQKVNQYSPYMFASSYYLPYFQDGMRFITTNCDTSFADIGRKLNKFDSKIDDNWATSYYKNMLNTWKEDSLSKRVFYIHGSVVSPETLVMSQREYTKAYDESAIAEILQIDAAYRKTILFLGSSLKEDRTVDVINKLMIAAGESGGERFIPVFSSVSKMNACLLARRKPMLVYDFGDISIILHQLIREADFERNGLYSWNQDLNVGKRIIDKSLEKKIEDLLDGNDAYKEEDFHEYQREDIISYLYNNHLSNNGKNGIPDWTLCQIYDSAFSLKLNGPLHNYPLGNTIYIIGGTEKHPNGYPKMDRERCKEITDEIKYWIKNRYPRYKRAEKFSYINKKQTVNPKIRIIRFESLLSYKELETIQKIVQTNLREMLLSNGQDFKQDQLEKIAEEVKALTGYEIPLIRILQAFKEATIVMSYKEFPLAQEKTSETSETLEQSKILAKKMKQM